MNNSTGNQAQPKSIPREFWKSSTGALPNSVPGRAPVSIYGLMAILVSLLFLSLLFISIGANGYSALQQTFIKLNVFFDPDLLRQEALASANYQGLVKNTLAEHVSRCQRAWG